MPQLELSHTTKKTNQECFQILQRSLVDDPDLKKLDKSYQCQFDSSTMTGQAKGKMFDAKMTIHPTGSDGLTKVTLSVKLPLMVTPFKGMVESVLTQKLQQLLGA